MCGRGRAGVRQERTAQYGGRMFVFATTQGFQGDMPSAMRQGLRENSKSIDAPCGESAAGGWRKCPPCMLWAQHRPGISGIACDLRLRLVTK